MAMAKWGTDEWLIGPNIVIKTYVKDQKYLDKNFNERFLADIVNANAVNLFNFHSITEPTDRVSA